MTPAEYESARLVKMLRLHEAAEAEALRHVKPVLHPMPPLAFAARIVAAVPVADVREVAERSAVLFGVTADETLSGVRNKRICAARAVTAYVARQLLRLSYPELARAMGVSNHTTILSAVRKVERAIERERPRIERQRAA